MWLYRFLALAVTVATLAIAPAAQATTVASVEAGGTFDIAETGDGIYVDVTSFEASFNPFFDPTVPAHLRLSASLDVGGFPAFSDSILLPNTSVEDLVIGALLFVGGLDPAILDSLNAVADVIEDNTGALTDIGFGLEFAFIAPPFAFGLASISGPFAFSIGETGFGLPSNDPTSFALTAQISAVPLPASALFLLAGLGGLAATRRMARKA